MTSEHLGHLCCLIIEDLYGSFLARIFGQLAEYGRLLSPHIAQRCRLPLRQVKAGLAALIQLRLIQHHSTVDGFSAYQANLPRAYELLRIGKLTSLAHKRHGPISAKVVQELASMGMSNPTDLVTTVQDGMKSEGEELDDDQVSVITKRVHNAMRNLSEDDFLIRVRPTQLQIPHDAHQEVDEDLKTNPPATDSKLKGKKAREQHLALVDAQLEQRLDSYLSPHTLISALDMAAANLNGVGVPGPADLYISVNYSRVVRSTRDSSLSQHVIKTFGENYAKITIAALSQVDLTAPSISAASSAVLPQLQTLSRSKLIEDLERPTGSHVDDNNPHTNGWHHEGELTNGIADTNGDVDRDDVSHSLASIAEGPYLFLKEANEGVWSVDKVALREFLLRQEIMKIAQQRVGFIGVRLVRILIDKGRLDEKILQEIGLLNVKDMRQSLANLHKAGFIEVQEVPKDLQRQPNRTIFLWFYDEARVQKALLEEIYKSMARLYQRMQHEREKVKSTLEKVEKNDCEGREDGFMSTAEVTLLQQFRRKEGWLLGEISRLDDSVALLRDL